MNLKNKVLFVVVAAISSSCVSVRQGPIPGVAKNGEPIWVKQTTKHVSYKVKEKVGESVLKDSSGNVIATSDRYVDKVQTDTFNYWYPMQGGLQIADEDFHRITGDEELALKIADERETAKQWRRNGMYVAAGGTAVAVLGFFLRTTHCEPEHRCWGSPPLVVATTL